jgi:beta-galactosidase
LLASAPRLALWRAPTDNDRISGLAQRWAEQGVSNLHEDPAEISSGSSTAYVERDVLAGEAVVRHAQTFTATADGGVHAREVATIPPELADLARVGTALELPPGLVEAEWFGLGPHESYPDRQRGALIGRWHASIGDLYVPYLWPQEAGGRAGVRWLELRDGSGRGVRLEMGQPMQVSATYHRAIDLDVATHQEELTPRPETIVHIDAAHRGLGTASCGPDTIAAYLVGPGVYSWEWSLHPIG